MQNEVHKFRHFAHSNYVNVEENKDELHMPNIHYTNMDNASTQHIMSHIVKYINIR